MKSLRTSSWWAEVQKHLHDLECEITWHEESGAFRAVNRAANLRACFHEDGIEVMSLSDDIDSRWVYELKSFGREGALVDVEKAEVRAQGRKITYVRSGMTEWYQNLEQGIEQGFVISASPQGMGAVVLQGRIGGDLDAHMASDARSISFLRDEEEILRYGKLLVTDAEGKELSSRLVMEGDLLSVVIEEEGRYPIYVDPLLENPCQVWMAAGNQEFARFGNSVACAGDVNGDSIDDVVVGAWAYDGTEIDEGRAFVYLGTQSGPSPDPCWTADGNQRNARFGVSVAGAGDVNNDGYDDIIVGAYAYDGAFTDEGRAFVYLGDSTGVEETYRWSADGNQEDAYFGYSVAGAGDVDNDGFADIIVGSHGYHNGEQLGVGRTYVYYGSASGVSERTPWVAEGDVKSNFGWSVASAGDVNNDGYSDVIIGAFHYDHTETNEGRAFVYLGDSTGVEETYCWSAEGDQDSVRFGYSVASAGDVNNDDYSDVIIGAYLYDHTETNEGRAFVYLGDSTGVEETYCWSAEGDQESAWFGISVACAGDVNSDNFSDIIVGAHGYNNPTGNEGRAFVFLGDRTGVEETYHWSVESGQNGALLGFSVASAGDVNNDDYSDVIIGALEYDHGEIDEGCAFVYSRCPTVGIRPQPFIAATWQDDHAEVTWILTDADLTRNVTFELSRRTTSDQRFSIIQNPDIAREANQFTLRDYRAEAGQTYVYRVSVNENGILTASMETTLETPAYSLMLFQNQPNPFNPMTNIRFTLPERAHASLSIYNIEGKLVKTLLEDVVGEGAKSITWNGTDDTGNLVSSGIYFCRLKAGDKVLTRKMQLIR